MVRYRLAAAVACLVIPAGSAAWGQGVASAAAGCTSATLCDAGVLAPVAATLRQADRRRVHIIQIGDSHTSGDTITAGLRGRLQARYGNGGRGVLPAGTPYRHYLTYGVTASETPGWISNTYFGRRWRSDGPAVGLSGFTRTAQAPGEWLAVAADTPEYHFDRATVCALTGPGQGSIVVRMGDRDETWSLDAPASAPACRTLTSPRLVSRASITTTSAAPVSITSFGTFRGETGVVVSNLGVGGSELAHFNRVNDDVLARELAAYRPDMVIIAYGTNEGFSNRLAEPYESSLRRQVTRLRRHLGRDVPIMLLGAPDAAVRTASNGSVCGVGAFTPNALGMVRQIQRRVARDMGLGFWDWEQAMGGRCAVHNWVNSSLMRTDLVHFTRDGGDRIGGMIFADLERLRPSASAAAPVLRRPDAPLLGSSSPATPPARSPATPAARPRLPHPGYPVVESTEAERRRPG